MPVGMTRIHLVALSPRSGTTLLAECMVACFAIDGFDAHETRVARLRRGLDIYLTKRPGDLRSVAPRLRLDPQFHVVCLLRDPRDVIVSRHGRDRSRYYVPLRVWKARLPIFRRLTTLERVHVVRYEDLVRDPDAVQRRLQEAMPLLVPTRAFGEFHHVAAPSPDSLAALGGLRPFDTASVGHWRRHLPRVAGQLLQHGSIADALVECGYERDAAWLSALDGVAPDLTPSLLPEQPRRRHWRLPHRSTVVVPWLSAGLVVAARAVGVRLV
jgi:hypothetical protein